MNRLEGIERFASMSYGLVGDPRGRWVRLSDVLNTLTEQGGERSASLVSMLEVWADWIESDRDMQDTNAQLCGGDLRKAARLLEAVGEVQGQ